MWGKQESRVFFLGSSTSPFECGPFPEPISVAGGHPAPSSRLALTQNCLPTYAQNFNSGGLDLITPRTLNYIEICI